MQYINLDDSFETYAESMTMIHVSFKGERNSLGLTALLENAYRAKLLDGMAVTIRPPFTNCSIDSNGVPTLPTRLCVTFELRAHTNPAETLRNLWAFLHWHQLKVTWKNKTTGYEIGENGAVLDSWELDDGMC